MSATRPFNPPFKKTNENGRHWCKTDELAKFPADLMAKLATSMQAPNGDWIEYQGYYYRAEKSKDGNATFFVQKSKEELEADKNKGRGGGWKGGKGGPRHPTIEAFEVAETVEQVNALIQSGFQPAWGDNGMQVATFARVNKADPKNPYMINGLFMYRPKKAE